MNTKMYYEFCGNVGTSDQLKIMAKYEKTLESVFLDGLGLTLKMDDNKVIWFEMFAHIGKDMEKITFCLSDKMLFLSDDTYEVLKRVVRNETTPFYGTITHDLINYMCNDGIEVKYTLLQAIEYIQMIIGIIRKELQHLK